jgi:uncharacterized protein (TIGR03437 family)
LTPKASGNAVLEALRISHERIVAGAIVLIDQRGTFMIVLNLSGVIVVSLLAVKAWAAIDNVVITSASSFEVGLPAKGSIASIFCTGLEGISGTVTASSVPLPRELAGVRVKIGGAYAPIFAVAALQGYQQINIQVPLETAIQLPTAPPFWPFLGSEDARTDLEIEQGDQRVSVRVILRRSPGDFFERDSGFAILQHASDYSLVTEENPARPDENLVAYLTGMPGALPAATTGSPSPSSPLAIVPQNGQVVNDSYVLAFYKQIGGFAVTPTFLGLAPGLVGVYQINFTLPEQQLIFSGTTLIPFKMQFLLARGY